MRAAQLRLAMMSPYSGTGSAIPGMTAMLGDQLRLRGWDVQTFEWGRRSDSESILWKVARRPADVLAIAKALKMFRPDVVLVQSRLDLPAVLEDLAWMAITARRPWKVVLVTHGGHADSLVPGSRHAVFRLLARSLLRRCDGVCVLSREEQSALSSVLGNVPVWLVDNPFVPPTGASCAPGEPEKEDEPTVLFVGRIVRAKGVFDLVEALESAGEPRGFRLTIAGDGPNAKALVKMVDERGLRDSVEMLGWVRGEELQHAYRSADVFALPTCEPEGFPTVLAEAMSYGLPIVCTPNRGVADRLQDGVNAVFVPQADPVALRAALLGLLRDRDLVARMSAENRRLVAAWAPHRVVAVYDDALRGLADRGSSDGV